MRIAIVGLPYSGKTSLFCALSGVSREQLNPTGENLAAVRIIEPRLDALEAMYKPKKRTEATLDFVDLPAAAEADGAVSAGLEKQLPSLRQSDGLLVVLRGFESPSVPPPPGGLNPVGELKQLREEMLLADLMICDNRVEKLEAAIKRPSPERDRQKRELELLHRCKEALEGERPLVGVVQPGEEEKLLRSFGFLTQKPLVVVVNVAEDQAAGEAPFTDPHATATYATCAALEAELALVEGADRGELMSGYGLTELRSAQIVRGCFDALGMMFFLTAGEQEVRAWPVPKQSTAVEAAGKIHSDLARGFIRAETVAYTDLITAGSMREAKAAGKVRQEPKTYVVQDGDVLNIKFNV